MEEYLLSQLDTPVVLKDGTMMTKPDGSPMTKQEAIATNILNLAMKGDVKAAQSDRFELSRQTGLRRKPKGKRKRTRITRIERIERINVGASPTHYINFN